jgi:hypothetical protein
MKHNSEDEQTLIKIQHEWAEARLKRDSSFPQRIEADDFTVVWFDGGIVNKEEDLKSYESDDVVFTDFKIDDLKVRFYGDMAIVVPRLDQSAHKNTRSEREVRVDGYICKATWRLDSRRVASDSSLGKIIADNYP